MSFSFPLACRLTASPQALQRRSNKSTVPFSTTIKNLTTNNNLPTFSSPQCKFPLHSSSVGKSFVRHAASPGEGEAVIAIEQLNQEQYKEERESIVGKIEVLEIKVQELLSKTTDADATKQATSASELEGILKDSYALGVQVTELEGKNPNPSTTPSSTTFLFESILNQFKGALSVSSSEASGLVPVNPNPNPGPTALQIDQMVKDTVGIYYTEDEPPFVDKFTDNYAPIREETTNLGPLQPYYGQLPEDINGVYLRVGPDPKYDPEANYQWLDGDGMVHGVRIKDGEARYSSHYVKNSRFLQEREFGKATMFKYGDLIGAYGTFVIFTQLLRQRLEVLDMSFGYTTSNVGVVYHAGRFMALEDFGKPHAISISDEGTMETVGMNDYNGRLNHNFTPHPKKDAATGEMFTIALSHTAPYAHYTVYSREGEITHDVPLTVSGPTYLHDLAITENYALIMDNPYDFNPEVMMRKDKWVFSFDASKKSRFGVLPRYASDEKDIQWFEFDDPSFIFHTVCAWEEGDTIVYYGCNMEPSLNTMTGEYDILPAAFRRFSNITTARKGSDDPVNLTYPELYKYTFNLSNGEKTKERVLPNIKVDNPKINEAYMARETQYAYSHIFDENNGKPYGIYKHDLQSGGGNGYTISVDGGEHTFLSEHVFVPRLNPTSEDDGYLLLFCHVENKNETHLVVLNARTMVDAVASVRIPKRIPYGLHSIFINEEELQNQVKILP